MDRCVVAVLGYLGALPAVGPARSGLAQVAARRRSWFGREVRCEVMVEIGAFEHQNLRSR